jgi:AraC family transcriptional activator of pobA
MKAPYSTVRDFTIGEVSEDAGRLKLTKEFHVIKSDELVNSDKIYRPSRSNHFTIGIIITGTCTVQCNLIEYSLQKDSLFIIPPGTVRQFLRKANDFSAILLDFTRDFLSSAELHKKHIDVFTFFSSQSDPHLLLKENEAEVLRTLMLLLHQIDLSGEEHPFRKEVVHHTFNLFMFQMGALFKKYRENEIVKLTRKEELLMSFVKLLALHFKEERSVQYYADLLFVTPKHLTKTVKEITGKTCGEFIDEMVISEAKLLLDDLNMSVGNVADALHFSDQFFFSKFFKNHTGVNPSEYKSSM